GDHEARDGDEHAHGALGVRRHPVIGARGLRGVEEVAVLAADAGRGERGPLPLAPGVVEGSGRAGPRELVAGRAARSGCERGWHAAQPWAVSFASPSGTGPASNGRSWGKRSSRTGADATGAGATTTATGTGSFGFFACAARQTSRSTGSEIHDLGVIAERGR